VRVCRVVVVVVGSVCVCVLLVNEDNAMRMSVLQWVYIVQRAYKLELPPPMCVREEDCEARLSDEWWRWCCCRRRRRVSGGEMRVSKIREYMK
jgi:hypothetical protein